MAHHDLRRLPSLRSSLGVAAAVVSSILLAACGSSGDAERLRFEGTLADGPLVTSSPNDPIELDHEQLTVLALDVTNPGSEPVTVSHVRVEGRMLELIFLTYDTGVNTTIDAGETRRLAFPIDFFDLGGQANGLLRAEIRLYDAERTVLASEPATIRANGDWTSNMSLFTLGLTLTALVTFVWNLLKIARRKLPANRFLRGLRFLYSGVAAGLAIAAAASTLAIWPLPPTVWVPLTAVAGLAAFAVGFLAPGRLIEYVDDEEEAGGPLIDLRTRPNGMVPATPIVEPVRSDQLLGPRPPAAPPKAPETLAAPGEAEATADRSPPTTAPPDTDWPIGSAITLDVDRSDMATPPGAEDASRAPTGDEMDDELESGLPDVVFELGDPAIGADPGDPTAGPVDAVGAEPGDPAVVPDVAAGAEPGGPGHPVEPSPPTSPAG